MATIGRITFQGLSQEALDSCVHSLLSAKSAIEQRATVLDGQLFYIKHLLILREQIAPFQVEFAVKESTLDFSKMKDAAYGLMQRKADVFKFSSSNALLRLFLEGTPQVTEHIVDSKREVDCQLKTSCEAFIDHVLQLISGPLKAFLVKLEAVESLAGSTGAADRAGHVQFRSQPFTKPESVRDAIAEAFRTLKARVPAVQRSMSLYLANRDTEQILLKPIKQSVLADTQKLLNIIERQYVEEERQIISCPSVDQVILLMAPKYS